MHNGGRVSLQIILNRFIKLNQQSLGVGLRKTIQMMFDWQWTGKQISGIAVISGDLLRPDHQPGKDISPAADACKISPCIRSVAGLNSDRIAMDTTWRFEFIFPLRQSSGVTQDQQTRRQ